MAAQHRKGDQLFDVPCLSVYFFTVVITLGIGSKMDTTMQMQNVMIDTKTRGLYTYPESDIASFFHSIVLSVWKAKNYEELIYARA